MDDQLAIDLGFDSAKDFHNLVASTPLLTQRQRARFRVWQDLGGTKNGLIKIIEKAKQPEFAQ